MRIGVSGTMAGRRTILAVVAVASLAASVRGSRADESQGPADSLGARLRSAAVVPADGASPAAVRRGFPTEAGHRLLDGFSRALDRSMSPVDQVRPVEAQRLERGFRRAARTAIKSAILDASDLDGGFLSRFDREFRGGSGTSSAPGSGVRFRVGVSHLVPKVELRSPLGRGALDVSVSALGRVALELSPSAAARPHLRLGFDPASRSCDLNARFAF